MSDNERKATTDVQQKRLNDFGTAIAEASADHEVGEAEIFDYYVDDRRAEHFDNDRLVETGPHEGLVVIFKTATGTAFTKWYKKPEPGDDYANLPVLLEYLEVDPHHLDDPTEMVGQRVPICRDHEGWEVDWETIDETVHADRRALDGAAEPSAIEGEGE